MNQIPNDLNKETMFKCQISILDKANHNPGLATCSIVSSYWAWSFMWLKRKKQIHNKWSITISHYINLYLLTIYWSCTDSDIQSHISLQTTTCNSFEEKRRNLTWESRCKGEVLAISLVNTRIFP